MRTFKSGLIDLGVWQHYEWDIYENEHEKFLILKLWEASGNRVLVTLTRDEIGSLTNSLETGLMAIEK